MTKILSDLRDLRAVNTGLQGSFAFYTSFLLSNLLVQLHEKNLSLGRLHHMIVIPPNYNFLPLHLPKKKSLELQSWKSTQNTFLAYILWPRTVIWYLTQAHLPVSGRKRFRENWTTNRKFYWMNLCDSIRVRVCCRKERSIGVRKTNDSLLNLL